MARSEDETPTGEAGRLAAMLGEAVVQLDGSVDGLAHYVSALDEQQRRSADLVRRHEELADRLGDEQPRLAEMLRATGSLLSCQKDLLVHLRRRACALIAAGGRIADGTTALVPEGGR